MTCSLERLENFFPEYRIQTGSMKEPENSCPMKRSEGTIFPYSPACSMMRKKFVLPKSHSRTFCRLGSFLPFLAISFALSR